MAQGPTMRDAQIDAAEAYEDLFIPALFGEWAPALVVAAKIRPGDRVLDVACGTGIVAREALARLNGQGSVAGVDANAGMVHVARRLAPNVDWREAAAESLPYPDQAFDAVLCQFGLMFFTDRKAALREMLRVLAPAGRLAAVVWGEIAEAPAFARLASLLERTVGRRAADALHAPFCLGDRRELEETFRAADVPSVTITTHRGKARFPSVRSLVDAELRGWLPVMGVALAEDQIQALHGDAEVALRPLVDPEGLLTFDMSAHIVTATRG